VKAVCDEAHKHGAKVKVIFENDYLTNGGAGLSSDDFKIKLCQLCERAGAEWVKTSSGYGFVKQPDGSYNYKGATEHDLALMRASVLTESPGQSRRWRARSRRPYQSRPRRRFQSRRAPVLAQQCFTCHGMDDHARKGKLRLDLSESAHGKGKSGEIAIVPGKPDASEVIKRILPPMKTRSCRRRTRRRSCRTRTRPR
jgi:hypothetical protein